MNNEEKILSILETLVAKVDELDAKVEKIGTDVSAIKTEQTEMKETPDAVFERKVEFDEFKTQITQEIDELIGVIKENTYDITKLKALRRVR